MPKLKVLFSMFQKIKAKMSLLKYDNYSIAEYFRSQGAKIGEDCFFGIRSLGDQPYLVGIGNHVQISTNVLFVTHNLGWCFRDEIPDLQVFGTITVNDNCYIGTNSIILPGVTIGPNAIIGAGSVVTKDVPPNSIAAGNPAREIAPIEKYKEKAIQLWKEQRPPDYLPELVSGKYYKSEYLHSLFELPENEDKIKRHLMKVFRLEEDKQNT